MLPGVDFVQPCVRGVGSTSWRKKSVFGFFGPGVHFTRAGGVAGPF